MARIKERSEQINKIIPEDEEPSAVVVEEEGAL
jgi:hypothetical protein